MVVGTGFIVAVLAAAFHLAQLAIAAPTTTVNITTISGNVEADWTDVYYGRKPLLLGNDGGAESGGLRAYGFDDGEALPEVQSLYTGRTKTLTVVHDVGGRDLAISIAAPESKMHVFELPSLKKLNAEFDLLGDWSAMCSWKSQSDNQYVFVFGKKQAVQFLVRNKKKGVDLVEVWRDRERFTGSTDIMQIQTFPLPFEASGCAVADNESLMFLHADDTTEVHVFALAETAKAPELKIAGESLHDVTGIAVYNGKERGQDYLFIAQTDTISIYEAKGDFRRTLQGTIKLEGFDEIEVAGLSFLQSSTKEFPDGALAFAIETDEQEGFAVISLSGVFEDLGLSSNTNYDPRPPTKPTEKSPICKTCSQNGYCHKDSKIDCECFAGFTGASCAKYTCQDKCSGHGNCIGPNVCKCDKGWGGLYCSFVLVEPVHETDPNGSDGDDPAIWISPKDPKLSRVITTVKSEEGAGLGVFDLQGKLLQHFDAPQPNNVDIIYDFKVGDRKVDLAFAACRKDDTLCLFEMSSDGQLSSIPGGSQPTVQDFSVYGSCVYRSPKTGKQYLFVNEKSARYLQYELTSTKDGELKTELVREFKGGNGGQVEGCVVDDENGWIFLGEEPSALWRYGAEPDSKEEDRVLIAEVGDGTIYGDVEGVTLVQGHTPEEGFILVSNQGVSAYGIYRRASPHEYVGTFTITGSKDGKIDRVTNTDGLAAVGTALGKEYPHGLLVVHDDANQLPDDTTSSEATFKLVPLDKVLGAAPLKGLGLLKQVDKNWSPRKKAERWPMKDTL